MITEGDWRDGHHDGLEGMIYFSGKSAPFSWYQVKPPLLRAVLEDLGFADIVQTRHHQLFVEQTVHNDGAAPTGERVGEEGRGVLVPHYTITARRA